MQKTERTVQGELEAALTQLTGARRPVLGSGRTDRGVHATGQVAAVTLPPRWRSDTLKRALNAVLPSDMWVQDVDLVPMDFNPRYAATARTYRYRVGVTAESHSPFRSFWCWSLAADVDVETLNAAAALLTGKHSFKSFAKAGQPERGEFCTVESAVWRPWEDLGLEFEIVADRYLHHMVRYLVGTMVAIGQGRRPLEDLKKLLDDPSQKHGRGAGSEPGTPLTTSPPAPPEGLFLSHVEYGSTVKNGAPGPGPTSPEHSPLPKPEAEPAS